VGPAGGFAAVGGETASRRSRRVNAPPSRLSVWASGEPLARFTLAREKVNRGIATFHFFNVPPIGGVDALMRCTTSGQIVPKWHRD